MLTILGHIGLGDQLVLNGLVRHFAEIEDCVIIFAQKSHMQTMEFMYRDILDKLKIIPLEGPGYRTTQAMLIHAKGKILPLGIHSMNQQLFNQLVIGEYSLYINWVCMLYIQAGLNPNTMYKKFKVYRDKTRELKPPDEPYIFVHDDQQRGRNLHIKTDKKIYKPSISKVNPDDSFECDNFNIFDYLTIIENASERHVMNSCYLWLIELFNIGNKGTNFFHFNVGAHDYFPEQNTRTTCTADLWTIVT